MHNHLQVTTKLT